MYLTFNLQNTGRQKLIIDRQKIEDYVNKMMFYYDIPGLSVGVGHDGQLKYEKGFGYKNIETKEKVDEQTVFHIASVAKLFVGTAIMQLMEKGLLDITHTVKEYVPSFNVNDSRCEKITIKQMLSHTSGMPDVENYEWDRPQKDEEALERYVKSLKGINLLWEPGERFSYSNIAYDVLGHLIAKVSGLSFEEYIQRNIFEPLNMAHSSFLTYKRDMKEMASPHIKDSDKHVGVSSVFPYNRIHGPSSTLTSDIKDIHIWALANLNKGSLEGSRILKESTYELMWDPIMPINEKERIGLSWFMRVYKARNLFGHEGSDTGFRSSFAIIPEDKVSVSVYANLQSVPTRRIQQGIMDILFEDLKNKE